MFCTHEFPSASVCGMGIKTFIPLGRRWQDHSLPCDLRLVPRKCHKAYQHARLLGNFLCFSYGYTSYLHSFHHAKSDSRVYWPPSRLSDLWLVSGKRKFTSAYPRPSSVMQPRQFRSPDTISHTRSINLSSLRS
jgi:hypothetical protein